MTMPQNTCGTPQNIYGPFQQTLFLGCSIMSFSAHMGWNQEVSEVTVQLVQDPCPAPPGGYKIYYDNNLAEAHWTAADPGMAIFNGGSSYPTMGSPVYFRIADFEFSGIIQSWQASDGTDGHPVYTVKLSDPRAVLEGTQLIIDKYAGSVYSNYNIFNVYGFNEDLAGNCSAYESSLTLSGYGGANVNSNGMPWNKIKFGIQALTSSLPPITGIYSYLGRIAYRGSTCSYGMGVLPSSGGLAFYMVDLSGLPFAPSYYRLSGPNVSILDAISTICSDAGCDFYVELLPTLIDGSIYNIIAIRTVSRSLQPALGAINTLLSASTNIINSSHGVELRNEIMANFVIGGPKQRIYEAEQDDNGTTTDLGDDMICPYFGIDQTTGYAIRPEKTASGEIFFTADLTTLNTQLIDSLAVSTARVYENEMRAAMQGFDEWLSMVSIAGYTSTVWEAFKTLHGPQGIRGIFSIETVIAAFQLLDGNNQMVPHQIIRGKDAQRNQAAADLQKDLQTAYEFIRTFGTEYYGRKYMVKINDICWKYDTESNNIITSEEVSDGGWAESGDNIIGLDIPTDMSDFFSLEDGRLQAFVRFDDVAANDYDLSSMSMDDCGIYADDAYIRVEVDQKLVYMEDGAGGDIMPRAVITLPQSMNKKFTGDAANLGWLGMKEGLAALDPTVTFAQLKQMHGNLGRTAMQWHMHYVSRTPDAAAVPFKSNILTYGPWPNTITAYSPGKVNTIFDDGLVPWEYDGESTMNTAGNERAIESVTLMYAGEMGNITIPGYPTQPLGAEISSTGTTFLFENRIAVSGASGTTLTPETWYGSMGPNITNISTEVGPGGVQTTYTMRSFTPQFGRFTKANVERLRHNAKINRENAKLFRKFNAFNTNLSARQQASANKIANGAANAGNVMDPGRNTPHVVLAGQLLKYNNANARFAAVASESIFDAAWELAENYSTKAAMSLDGLLRPVSVSGDGGLPRFATALSGCQVTSPMGAMPPMKKGSTSGSDLYKLDIRSRYLNPLQGSGGDKHGTGTGHDFDILAHGTGAHTGSYSLHMQGFSNSDKMNYASDYRFMAMRGPMVMTGWGYDLDGKPIPNAADSEGPASSGTFTEVGLQDTFLTDWMQKSHTWPVGPVDLRFDRRRGVWVSPPAYRLVMGQLTAALSANGTASAKMIDMGTTYLVDGAGSSLTYDGGSSTPYFTVTDKIGKSYSSGDKFIASYDAEQCKYYIIEGPSSGNGSSLIRFRLLQDKALNADVSGEKIDYQGNVTETPIKLIDSIGEWGIAQSGWSGWAALMTDRPSATPTEYEIVFIEAPYRFRNFVLTSDMAATTPTLGWTATANFTNPVTGSYGSAPNGRESFVGTANVYDRKGLFKRALSGASGYAIYNEQINKYEVINCQTKAELIQFRLDGSAYDQPWSTTDTASTTVLSVGGSMFRSQSPGATVNVKDSSRTFLRALAGATGIALYDDKNDTYVAVECQTKAEAITFRTVSDEQFNVAGGGPTLCQMIDYARGQKPADQFDFLNVIDPVRLYRRAKSGATGIAIYDSISDNYAVVDCQNIAEGIAFTASNQTINTPFAVTPTQYWRGQDPGSPNAIDILGLLSCITGGQAIATYDEINGRYIVTAVDKRLRTIGKDNTNSAYTNSNTSSITFHDCFKLAQTDCDTNVAPRNSNDISFLSSVTWDALNCQLVFTRKTLTGVMSCGTFGADTEINAIPTRQITVVTSGRCESGVVTLNYSTGVRVIDC